MWLNFLYCSLAPGAPLAVPLSTCPIQRAKGEGCTGWDDLHLSVVDVESPQMWVWPQLPFGRSPPHSPPCNWRTLPSSHSPSLPALLLPLPPTPWLMLRWSGRGRPRLLWGRGIRRRELEAERPTKRHLGPDPHLGVLKDVAVTIGAKIITLHNFIFFFFELISLIM